MKARQPFKKTSAGRKWLCVFLALLAMLRQNRLLANPTGMSVVSGSATAQQLGSQLNITVSQAAILNWQSFNIGAGETTSFLQPAANSVVLNLIGGANPSQIFGGIKANGTVILENANGFYFGPDSMVKVGGSFIATTAPLTPDFGSGAGWQFSGPPPLASIVNYGQIEAGAGKSLFLIAEKIENHGSLNAPGGTVDLAAGQSVLVSESPDGRGLSAAVTLPQGSVDNFGRITADGGSILMQAKVVNQNGVLQADSVRNQNGVIELVASDQVNLGANSQILAQGDDSAGGSAGGTVTLKSGNLFSDATGSQIITTGGANGGNGGNIEISAPNIQSLNSTMDASAQSGFAGGEFLLDPVNIILGTSTAGGAINVNTAFAGFSTILLQATGDITLNANTSWNLSSSTGKTTGQLTLEAGGDIVFGNKSKILDANDWSISLYAGYNFNSGAVQSGVGNIYLNGGSGQTQNGAIQLSAGDINLFAGESILVAPLSSSVVSGSIFTTGGGNIFAYAMAGDIVAGTSNGSANGNTQTTDYNFNSSGAKPNPYLGGISTAAGGNVTLIAGNSIDSTPIVPSREAPGASGAYGAGDVTVIAGNQITGNFTLADGTGTLLAGAPVSAAQAAILQNPGANAAAYLDTLGDLVTAVKQSQNVNGNIGAPPIAGVPSTSPVTLSVINGTWNAYAANDISLKEVNNPDGAFNTSDSFLFNYAPNAAANFWAGNAIELIGENLKRLTAVNTTPIYTPILSLNAGAGGILIDKSIILAPSSGGSLTLITRDGGNLSSVISSGAAGSTPVLSGIIMSDSGSTAYADYLDGHAATPLHLNDSNPVMVDVSGSINSFSLVVPTFAQINVVGNTYNFGFQGQNLSSSEATTINVGQTAKVNMEDIGLLSAATDSSLPVGGEISYQAFSVANADVTLGNQGLAVAGPGHFNVTADVIDLGVSGGISVLGPDAPLAAISPYGADLNVTTLGDLSMTSTKISNESLLGSITLNVGGALNVGGSDTTLGDPSVPRGIFTTSGGEITVDAVGNVNVASSRIAAYDGGNVSVTSQTGDVNAGTGGAGFVALQALELDASTHELAGIPATIPGSGILATTVFGSGAALGNITINAPQGSLDASLGGVLQIAFNSADTKGNTINVTVGNDINATGSGIIGYNVNLKAGGNINGVVVGSQSVAVNAQQNVDVTAVSGGSVNINAAGTVSGTVIGGGDVSVSGSSIDAAVRGGSVSTSGDTSGASLGVPSAGPAQNVQVADNANTVGSKTDANDEDDLKKKKGITLARKVGRVTVLLPGKN
jgi:filamentous hemagglutinin family protein